MPLPRPSSPRALWADLKAFAAESSPYKWGAAAVAVIMPIAIVIVFTLDTRTNIDPPTQIIYVESWPASRSEAEIKAQQAKDKAKADAFKKKRQAEFQKVDEGLERLGI
jgi:hypothetical protein